MSETPQAMGRCKPDQPLVLYDILEEIASLQSAGADPVEVERLAEEYRRLRAVL